MAWTFSPDHLLSYSTNFEYLIYIVTSGEFCALIFLGEDNIVTRCLAAINDTVGAPIQIYRCAEGLPPICAAAVLDRPWCMDFVREKDPERSRKREGEFKRCNYYDCVTNQTETQHMR
jgi:hypothetical protein